MPTLKGLNTIWKAQFKLFDGYGVPRSQFEIKEGGHGLADQRHTDSKSKKRRTKKIRQISRDLKEDESEIIRSLGKISYNESTCELVLQEDSHEED